MSKSECLRKLKIRNTQTADEPAALSFDELSRKGAKTQRKSSHPQLRTDSQSVADALRILTFAPLRESSVVSSAERSGVCQRRREAIRRLADLLPEIKR